MLFGENVGIGVWKPFLDAYYSIASLAGDVDGSRPGIVTRQVCKYDGGTVATSGGFNEIFLKGVGEPTIPAARIPIRARPPYVAPIAVALAIADVPRPRHTRSLCG